MPTFESLPDFEHGRPDSLGVLIVTAVLTAGLSLVDALLGFGISRILPS